MSRSAIQPIAHQENNSEERAARPHLFVYGWIYVVFIILTALALYVIFTVPQGDI
jgi:hypothetical protein